jgi:hypothetical protein
MMPSLPDLHFSLLLQIAALVGFESAGRLSLVNKHMHAAITLVLPSLCALILLLPYEKGEVEGSDLLFQRSQEHFKAFLWWGVAVVDANRQYLRSAVSNIESNGRYHPARYDESTLRLPFKWRGQYEVQVQSDVNLVQGFQRLVLGDQDHSLLDQSVINTILQGAKDALRSDSRDSVRTINRYLGCHTAESVDYRKVAKGVENALVSWIVV